MDAEEPAAAALARGFLRGKKIRQGGVGEIRETAPNLSIAHRIGEAQHRIDQRPAQKNPSRAALLGEHAHGAGCPNRYPGGIPQGAHVGKGVLENSFFVISVELIDETLENEELLSFRSARAGCNRVAFHAGRDRRGAEHGQVGQPAVHEADRLTGNALPQRCVVFLDADNAAGLKQRAAELRGKPFERFPETELSRSRKVAGRLEHAPLNMRRAHLLCNRSLPARPSLAGLLRYWRRFPGRSCVLPDPHLRGACGIRPSSGHSH